MYENERVIVLARDQVMVNAVSRPADAVVRLRSFQALNGETQRCDESIGPDFFSAVLQFAPVLTRKIAEQAGGSCVHRHADDRNQTHAGEGAHLESSGRGESCFERTGAPHSNSRQPDSTEPPPPDFEMAHSGADYTLIWTDDLMILELCFVGL